MNEFEIIKKYLRPLAKKDPGSLNLSDDIYFNKKKGLSITVDTYVEGIHFVNSEEPKYFLKKVIRSSLSDLYSKGIKPESYFLSFALNKKLATKTWLSKISKILKSEQNRFNISLGGGDTVSSKKLIITIVAIGFSFKKPVLRKGSKINNDVYVTGNIGDSFLGLCVIKKRMNLGIYNTFFKKKYYEPDLALKIFPYLNKIATAAIDISDGLSQDLNHICKESKCGALIDLSSLPLSSQCKKILTIKKLNIKNIFSNCDDYQILFTSKSSKRNKIKNLSKKLNLKITKIGKITKGKNIIFRDNCKNFRLSAIKMGYTHIF